MGKIKVGKETILAFFATWREIPKKFMCFVKGPPIEPRDVSPIIQVFRDHLLGHKYVKHTRFEQYLSPRSIPPPEIPSRGDEYFDRYYFNRHALNSVKPPIIVDMGRIKLTQTPPGQCECYTSNVPTPGQTWWWDGHCYYEDSRNLPAK